MMGRSLIYHWRIETNRNRTEDEYGMIIKALFDHAISFSEIRRDYYFLRGTTNHVFA